MVYQRRSMLNKTGSLMLHTIMVLMDQHNTTGDLTHYTSAEPAEIERCYPPYGCFSIAYPWVTETRPHNLFPQPPDKLRVRFPIFTRRNLHAPLILDAEDVEAVRNSNIHPSGPFYVISHGYMESGDKPWIERMARSLLAQEGHAGATVVVVDWRLGAGTQYTQAVANIRLVGVIAAHFLHLLYEELDLPNLDNVHYIGHSLGAHLGGYCGHTLQTRFALRLGRITGLDPAEPHFARTAPLVRLDRSDALYVDIIHSDASPFISGGFGISEAIGHVDFFPNGGNDQPGCDRGIMDSVQTEEGSIWRGMHRHISCNHVRSYEYFIESIAPSCPFYAVQCQNYQTFLAGNCSECDRDHVCLPLGMHSQTVYTRLAAAGLARPHTSLTMFSLTGDRPPFCRVHYKVVLELSKKGRGMTEEVGQFFVTFVDVHGRTSDRVPLDKERKYHDPGSVVSGMVAARGTGGAPVAVLLEWRYETDLFNILTWRLTSSPHIHVSRLQLSSLEYGVRLDVCPPGNQLIVANVPTHLNATNCAPAT